MTPQEIEALKTELDALAGRAEKAELELVKLSMDYNVARDRHDALAAQVKLMADTLKNFHPDCFEYQENDFDLGDDVVEVLSKTPQQCLRDVQAEAGWKGFIAGYNAGNEYRFSGMGDELAEEYAATVRKGGA